LTVVASDSPDEPRTPTHADARPAHSLREREICHGAWEHETTEIENHWETVKKLRGNTKVDAMEYLKKRDTSKCTHCNEPVANIYAKFPEVPMRKQIEIDHINCDERNNWRGNVRLVHKGCNTAIYWQRKHFEQHQKVAALSMQVGVREVESRARVSTKEWGSAEGQVSEVLTALFEEFVFAEDGPFWVRSALTGEREKRLLEYDLLAKMAAKYCKRRYREMYGVAHGSSTTMRRYIDEATVGESDREPGDLRMVVDDGRKMVELVRKDFVKRNGNGGLAH
jgi:hypothetical protein